MSYPNIKKTSLFFILIRKEYKEEKDVLEVCNMNMFKIATKQVSRAVKK